MKFVNALTLLANNTLCPSTSCKRTYLQSLLQLQTQISVNGIICIEFSSELLSWSRCINKGLKLIITRVHNEDFKADNNEQPDWFYFTNGFHGMYIRKHSA